MLIRNVQVARNFFTILLSLYNSALLSGQPKLKMGKYMYATRLTCPADDSEKKWIPEFCLISTLYF